MIIRLKQTVSDFIIDFLLHLITHDIGRAEERENLSSLLDPWNKYWFSMKSVVEYQFQVYIINYTYDDFCLKVTKFIYLFIFCEMEKYSGDKTWTHY